MGIIENILNLIHAEATDSCVFWLIYLLFVVCVIAFSVFVCIIFKDACDSTFRVIIGWAFVIMLTFEILKQTFVPMSIIDGELVYSYIWSEFPFQLCSTPLYVLPFLSFAPDGKLRDLAASYTMTFGLLGGIAVYMTPKSVFSFSVFLNIQTMLHHALQIVTGIYTAAYYRRRINRRFFAGGVCVFAIMFAIANLLNTVGYSTFVSLGWIPEGGQFNMFYVSPRPEQITPMFSELIKGLPPILYIVVYFVVVTVGAGLLMYVTHLFYKYSRKRLSLKA